MKILKYIFDRTMALIGLLFLWPILLIVAILIKKQMPGPVFFVQQRVGKDGKLFPCHKFRTMTIGHNGTSISIAGESRITPLGAKLRRYKLDELPELWDVLIGNMSFVGPRPDVPGYADKLQGENRIILTLRPGITGPATLKYRNEEDLSRLDEVSKFPQKFDVQEYLKCDMADYRDLLKAIEPYEVVFAVGVSATLRNSIAKECIDRNRRQ